MISQDKLLFFSNFIKDIPYEEVANLFSRAVERRLNVGEIYIHQNEFSQKLAYITQGVIRTYTIKQNGEEATLLFRWDDQFVGSHDSILLNNPSGFIYQAIEKTSLLEIDYADIESEFIQNPGFEPLRKFILMNMLSASLKMLESFVLLTPEERYLQLLSENPVIVNRVADKHLASMLGITPVTLSRIRKRITMRSSAKLSA